MNVNMHFPPEIEHQLQRRAAAAGQDVDSFVRQIVAEYLAHDDQLKRPRKRSRENFRQQLEKIIARHPRSNGQVDDSRESIYAGRDE